jgi:DNA-binding MarR family transcriptional regulator
VLTGVAAGRLLGRLERSGAIVAEVDPIDGRANTLRPTPAGEEKKATVLARRCALLETALRDVAHRLPDELLAGLDAIAVALDQPA